MHALSKHPLNAYATPFHPRDTQKTARDTLTNTEANSQHADVLHPPTVKRQRTTQPNHLDEHGHPILKPVVRAAIRMGFVPLELATQRRMVKGLCGTCGQDVSECIRLKPLPGSDRKVFVHPGGCQSLASKPYDTIKQLKSLTQEIKVADLRADGTRSAAPPDTSSVPSPAPPNLTTNRPVAPPQDAPATRSTPHQAMTLSDPSNIPTLTASEALQVISALVPTINHVVDCSDRDSLLRLPLTAQRQHTCAIV